MATITFIRGARRSKGVALNQMKWWSSESVRNLKFGVTRFVACASLSGILTFAIASAIAEICTKLGLIVDSDIFYVSKGLVGDIVLGIGLAPITETFALFLLIKVFKKLTTNSWVAVLGTALIFSALHSISGFMWGVVIFVPFIAFTAVLWQGLKINYRVALMASAGMHAVHNTLALLVFHFSTSI